jgi:hypothetical protein
MHALRWLAALAAGSFLLIGVFATAPFAGLARQDSTPPPGEQIGADEAAAIAQEAYPDAEVVEIEAEEEDGGLVYSVELSNGVEVEIDATTGEIIEEEREDDDANGDDEDNEDEDEEEDDDEDKNGDEGDEDDEDDEESGRGGGAAADHTSTFYLDQCEWSSTGGNLFFRLDPGLQLVLQGEEDGAALEVVVSVLDETETVNGLETRVVEERESEDGELVEVSRNFFAACVQTGSVFYFGEEVDDYEDGQVVGHEGAWRVGEGENRPGLIMPAQPLLGARYYQEIAPGIAEDATETVAVGVTAEVPAGTFEGCIVQMDVNPLNPGPGDEKVYCPGIGLVQDEALVLVEVIEPASSSFHRAGAFW